MKGSVVIVSFSARKHGNCENIADRLQAIFPEAVLYRFSEFTIQPCGRCHYECFSPSGLCPQADNQEQTLMEAIVRSKMTFFVVPNYCDYPCANFFAFNERSQCYFQHRPELVEAYMEVPKKFIVVSSTGQDNFREAFRQHTNEEPAILFLSARNYGKVSLAGDLMTSQEARQAAEAFATSPKSIL